MPSVLHHPNHGCRFVKDMTSIKCIESVGFFDVRLRRRLLTAQEPIENPARSVGGTSPSAVVSHTVFLDTYCVVLRLLLGSKYIKNQKMCNCSLFPWFLQETLTGTGHQYSVQSSSSIGAPEAVTSYQMSYQCPWSSRYMPFRSNPGYSVSQG